MAILSFFMFAVAIWATFESEPGDESKREQDNQEIDHIDRPKAA